MASSIHQYRWHPSTSATAFKPRGVYLLHGIGEHAGRYERLANRLTTLGYEVAAHDHPGHGKSTGKRGVINSDDELELTSAEQLQAFADETGATPFLFGHSLGGLVATSMVLNHKVEVAGLLLSAPAFAPLVSASNKLKLALLSKVAPNYSQELAYDPCFLTHDKIEQDIALHDPLNHRFKSVRIVMWLIRTGKLAIEKADMLDVPALVLIAGADVVVDSNQVRNFVTHAPDHLITHHIYKDYLHEILNETPERRDRAMADIENWLMAQE